LTEALGDGDFDDAVGDFGASTLELVVVELDLLDELWDGVFTDVLDDGEEDLLVIDLATNSVLADSSELLSETISSTTEATD